MLPTLPADYRSSSEDELVAGLRAGDGLALAEAYHRTCHAVYASARRLLARPDDIDALLFGCYQALWREPPEDDQLEGWLRRRCFERAVSWLRSTQTAPAAASVHELLPDLPAPAGRRDPLEETLARLEQTERAALLGAHDAGRRSSDQELPDAASALRRALVRLADPDSPDASDLPCLIPELADWVLGLVSREEAARIAADVPSDRACETLVRLLRRGRRRLEALPPTPDTGQRVIAAVLSGTPASAGDAEATRPAAAGAVAAGSVAASTQVVADAAGEPAAEPEPGEHTQPWRLSDLLAADTETGPDPDADITPPPMLDDEAGRAGAEAAAEGALPSDHTFDEVDSVETDAIETPTTEPPESGAGETVVRIRTDGADEATATAVPVEEDEYDVASGPTVYDDGFGEPFEARRGGRWAAIIGFLLLLALGVVAGLLLGPALVDLLF